MPFTAFRVVRRIWVLGERDWNILVVSREIFEVRIVFDSAKSLKGQGEDLNEIQVSEK
jgi:hypothetical protein